MAIKNSDGSEYYFSKPNPMLLSQNIWPDDEEIILEGTFGQRYVLDIPLQKETVVEKEVIAEDDDIKIINTIAKKQEEEILLPNNGPKTMWCLPVEVATNTYGQKFTLLAKVYDDSSDLFMQIITKQLITKNSILYNERRWWKVTQSDKMEQEGFYLVSAEISDYQPSFSD